MAEEVDFDAVGVTRVLVEREDDHVAGGEGGEDRVERAALRQHAETRLVEPSRDERVEPSLDRAAHEMEGRGLPDSFRCRRSSRPPSCRNGR
jgi:hypothetical protein